MNIDWSKAPKGATHFDTAEYRTKSFMKLENGAWYFWPPMSSEPQWSYWGADSVDSDTGPFVARPTDPLWNGKGLPPVGAECEYLENGNGYWKPVRVVALDEQLRHGDTFIVVHGDNGYSGDSRIELFRPIRTTEQIAAEERAAAVSAMLADAGVTDSAWNEDPETVVWAEALYDAGYRKQVKP